MEFARYRRFQQRFRPDPVMIVAIVGVVFSMGH
jgi:hypothetical protein